MVYTLNRKVNERLYKNAVLYFIKYCNNQYLGKTKLNKLLYYLDFIWFRDNKTSITGDIYVHQEYGPVPAHSEEILADLKSEGAIDAEAIAHKDGEKIKFKIKNEKLFDENVFSSEQKNLLKQICGEFGSWSTDKIVNQTHLEAPWFFSKPLEIVDYSYSKDIDFFLK
jgi:uncharacterized phage-associated protein